MKETILKTSAFFKLSMHGTIPAYVVHSHSVLTYKSSPTKERKKRSVSWCVITIFDFQMVDIIFSTIEFHYHRSSSFQGTIDLV